VHQHSSPAAVSLWRFWKNLNRNTALLQELDVVNGKIRDSFGAGRFTGFLQCAGCYSHLPGPQSHNCQNGHQGSQDKPQRRPRVCLLRRCHLRHSDSSSESQDRFPQVSHIVYSIRSARELRPPRRSREHGQRQASESARTGLSNSTPHRITLPTFHGEFPFWGHGNSNSGRSQKQFSVWRSRKD